MDEVTQPKPTLEDRVKRLEALHPPEPRKLPPMQFAPVGSN